MSQFFTSSGQSIGVSASAISPSNEYSGLIDLLAAVQAFSSFREQDLLPVTGPRVLIVTASLFLEPGL